MSNSNIIEEKFNRYYDLTDERSAVILTLAYVIEHGGIIYSKEKYLRLIDGGVHTMSGIDLFVINAFKVKPDLAKKYIMLQEASYE